MLKQFLQGAGGAGGAPDLGTIFLLEGQAQAPKVRWWTLRANFTTSDTGTFSVNSDPSERGFEYSSTHDHVIVANATGIYFYDVSDLSSVSLTSSITSINCQGIVINDADDLLYAAVFVSPTWYLKVYDISTIASPSEIGSLVTDTLNVASFDFDSVSKNVFVSAVSNNTYRAYDVSTPASPTLLSSNTATINRGLAIDVTNDVAITTGDKYVASFDISNPSTLPTLSDSLYNASYNECTKPLIDASNQVAYVGSYLGLMTVDYSTITNISVTGTESTYLTLNNLNASGCFIPGTTKIIMPMLLSNANRLVMYDVATPTSVTVEQLLSAGDDPLSVVFRPNPI